MPFPILKFVLSREKGYLDLVFLILHIFRTFCKHTYFIYISFFCEYIYIYLCKFYDFPSIMSYSMYLLKIYLFLLIQHSFWDLVKVKHRVLLASNLWSVKCCYCRSVAKLCPILQFQGLQHPSLYPPLSPRVIQVHSNSCPLSQ